MLIRAWLAGGWSVRAHEAAASSGSWRAGKGGDDLGAGFMFFSVMNGRCCSVGIVFIGSQTRIVICKGAPTISFISFPSTTWKVSPR